MKKSDLIAKLSAIPSDGEVVLGLITTVGGLPAYHRIEIQSVELLPRSFHSTKEIITIVGDKNDNQSSFNPTSRK